MRIGVDMHVLQGMHQGSRKYLEGVYAEVLHRDQSHEWHFFLDDVTGGHPDLGGGNVIWEGFGGSSRLGRLTTRSHTLIRRKAIDCIHYQYVLPLRKQVAEVVTVHDILFESHPQYFHWASRQGLKWLVRRSSTRAEAVLTVSEYSRQQLIERYRIPAERIHITPNGIDAAIFHPGLREESRQKIELMYGIKDFFLTVGRIEPRKNHLKLLEAYSLLKKRGRDLPPLAMVGAKDAAYQDVMTKIRELGLEKEVLHIQNLPNDVLGDLYRAALFFIYPSFAEGFGIPVIEAMACGCPVGCSGRTSLAELVDRDCGLLFDPDLPEQIADTLMTAIESPSRTADIAVKGLVRATEFTWSKSADNLLKVYAQLS